MKTFNRVVALALVLALISSFALVFSLSAFPEHNSTHICPEAGCAVCAVVNFARSLFSSVGLAAVVFCLLIFIRKGCFLPFSKEFPAKQVNETPVTLKIKITM